MSSSVRVTAPTTNSSGSSSSRPVNHDAHLPTPKTGDKFVNPWPSYHGSGTPMDFLIAKLRGEIPLGAVPTDVQSQVGWQALKQVPNAPERLKAAWLGHASLYFEFPSRLPSSQASTPPIGSREKKREERGIRILVDPIFSGRCSPTQFFGGPKRYTEPATSVDALEGIDVLCLSHNHYDHLDSGTITRLHKKFPQLVYFVPLRVRDWFLRCGIDAAYVHEMDWWEELIYERGDDDNLRLKIGYLPAQHFTGRSLRDQGATLWGSFALTELLPGDEEGKKVYFAGDTGRRTIPRPLASALKSEDGAVRAKAQVELDALPTCPAHKEIRAFRGPFDLVVIPIGAYEPRHFMSRVHVDPGEAVDIFVDLTTTPTESSTSTSTTTKTTVEKSRKTVGLGVHWGTFQLSYEDVLEPRRALARITKERNIQDFGCWKIGELVEL